MNKLNLLLAINWLFDLHEGEMIEARNYTKDFLGFDKISQKDLESIQNILNILLVLIFNRSDIFRVDNSMGELIPLRIRK